MDEYAVVGELALAGFARPVKGALSITIEAAKNKLLRTDDPATIFAAT